MDHIFQTLGVRLGAGDGGDIVEHIFQTEFHLLQLHAVSLDLGKIEDAVDDAQQRDAGGMDLFDVVALLRVQIGAQRQMRHADDGIHGRAQFVAHIGQKQGLGLVGLFGMNARRFRFLQFDLHMQVLHAHTGGLAL